ncbi:hypothetical protein OEIGOIKO_05841 [Streptomyces chrestomyceticus JCM 4735]|uniref:Uncharacterized protein n=1 Tax=Streptomyces chrestomyceticus JCM 4735 TaxID=1306181 RepID=A0A7U9L1T7_9ACTN|nr:hypothetical protein [Streptomyces chrestomyceticus]GCD38031.1 hypothetical protein OEIGOIKO_05841 [Streptomyces chrestomyceticus JCM 4735]
MSARSSLSAEQRAALAAALGDAKSASAELIVSFGQTVTNVREHEHPKWEDLYCLNLVSFMGERMAPVLRRLLDAESEAERLRATRAAIVAERDAQIIAWLLKKAREHRSTRRRQHAEQADVIEKLASKIARDAVRPDNLGGARSYWEAIANALNAANDAGMHVGIDLDGTLTDRDEWSVVWDRTAERWRVAGYDDAEGGAA